VRARSSHCRGFTLIELIASITIAAIIATVALPRTTVATPFLERGYVDALAASLRQARAVAQASGCDVQFTVNVAGYSAMQHNVSVTVANHCATGGAWGTAVRRGDGDLLAGPMPVGVALAANRQFVFSATDGTVAGAPYNITVGPHVLVVEPSGLVH
jgi:prepilin-type N-terminal cleavage/methylation domain-containing protein